MTLRQLVDLPPLWLVAFLVPGWFFPRLWPGLVLNHPVLDLLAGLLVGAGILLTGLAVVQMRQHRTTPIPHRQASTLVTSGIFALSRNPIYLGDLMLFTGFTLIWGAWPCLALAPVFLWILTVRFIRPEEGRLKENFGRDFDSYCRKTRRWL